MKLNSYMHRLEKRSQDHISRSSPYYKLYQESQDYLFTTPLDSHTRDQLVSAWTALNRTLKCTNCGGGPQIPSRDGRSRSTLKINSYITLVH